jgi:hypothetical protein
MFRIISQKGIEVWHGGSDSGFALAMVMKGLA